METLYCHRGYIPEISVVQNTELASIKALSHVKLGMGKESCGYIWLEKKLESYSLWFMYLR